MKAKTIKAVQEMTKSETLLGLGMIIMTSGTYAIMNSDYLNGLACLATGFGILFLRRYIKNGF